MQTFPFVYNLSKRELYDKVIEEVLTGEIKDIQPDVYRAYSENLRKAVAGVLSSDEYGDRYFDLQAQLQANVSRFAAYKAYHLTEQLKRQRDKWPDDNDYKKVAKAVINTFNRYQAAEYNTAVARSRTAKQWTDFKADPIANELYPNLKWLPSRSAEPRIEHQKFYGLVLPKKHPFWLQNQPGNLWNCKCDWEETDAPIDTRELTTEQIDQYSKNGGGVCAKGLEDNPAETGRIFGDECTYFKQVSNTKARKLEGYLFNKIYRNETNESLKAIQGEIVRIAKQDETIDVVFDRKTTKHLSNDVAEHKDYLLYEIAKHTKGILNGCKLVAHEENTKPDIKPSAIHYYYYEYRIGEKSFYFNVEENYVTMENRHFYRMYSITDELRETAILYK